MLALDKGTAIVHADNAPAERWFVLEEFSREHGSILTIARKESFFGLFSYWHRVHFVWASGEPSFSLPSVSKTFDSLKSAIEVWDTIKAWEARELEKKNRKKFRTRIVYPIFVSPTHP